MTHITMLPLDGNTIQ